MTKKLKKYKAASLIEFALFFPMYIIIIMGIIDYSIFLYNNAIVKNASWRSTRYGTMRNDSTYATVNQVTTYAQSVSTSHLLTFTSASKPLDISVVAPAAPKSGDQLTVTIKFQYTHLPFFTYMGFSPVDTISSTTTMMYE